MEGENNLFFNFCQEKKCNYSWMDLIHVHKKNIFQKLKEELLSIEKKSSFLKPMCKIEFLQYMNDVIRDFTFTDEKKMLNHLDINFKHIFIFTITDITRFHNYKIRNVETFKDTKLYEFISLALTTQSSDNATDEQTYLFHNVKLNNRVGPLIIITSLNLSHLINTKPIQTITIHDTKQNSPQIISTTIRLPGGIDNNDNTIAISLNDIETPESSDILSDTSN